MQIMRFSLRLRLHAFALLFLLCGTLYAADESTDNNSSANGNTVPVDTPALPEEQSTQDNTNNSDKEAQQNQQPVQRIIPDPAASRHEGLLQYLQLNNRQYEMVRLIAAETEFYGLLLSETLGQPQGGVLILHDNGQHSHWPEIVAPLRETLPAYGWTTLSIELPEQPSAQPPAGVTDSGSIINPGALSATEKTSAAEATPDNQTQDQAPAAEIADSAVITATDKPENEEQQDSAFNAAEPALPRLNSLPPRPDNSATPPTPPPQVADAKEKYRQQMLARIRQGVGHLNQRGQLNIVVIACGNSANWAVEFLLGRSQAQAATDATMPDKETARQRGLALILIDALDNPLSAVPLNQQMIQLDIPLLDLISEQTISPVYANQQRAGAMRHKQRQQYRQIAIPAFDLNYDDSNPVVRRVRGWLKTNAAGTELAAASRFNRD